MLRIAVCDDDSSSVEKISNLINNNCNIQNYQLEKFYSGEDIIASDIKFDIVILDMEMNELDGINTAKILRQNQDDFILIFLTAYKEKIRNAFEVDTFRFLMKPLEYSNLINCINEAVYLYNKASVVIIRNKNDYVKVKVSKIIYFEALENTNCVRMTDGEMTTQISIGEYEEQLANCGFYRTHKSYLVNFEYVSKILNDRIILDNDEAVKISRRKRSDFVKKYHRYLRDKLK